MPRRFSADERAVEGMPVRLLVAVTVGIAAFALLVPMAESVEQVERTELTVEPEPRPLTVERDEPTSVRVDIITTDGEPVEGATLVVSGRSLAIEDGPLTFEADGGGSVTFDVGLDSTADVPVTFRATQNRGTLRLRVVGPPSDEHVDNLSNPDLTVRLAER